MVNTETLDVLNKLGFGADIDSLESYVLDYMQASIVSSSDRYEHNYTKLRDILKELKPGSSALTYTLDLMGLDWEETDRIFYRLGNEYPLKAYGLHDKDKLNRVRNMTFCNNKIVQDIVAIENVEGLDALIIYNDGELTGVYAISELTKHFDITEVIGNLIPKHSKVFAKFGLVELRARLTIKDITKIRHNILCDVMHSIRTGVNTEKICVVFTDIFTENNSVFRTYWNKLEFLNKCGFKTARHCLLRNIDSISFNQAVIEMDKYFHSNKQAMEHKISGIRVKKNSEIDTAEYILEYDTYNVSNKMTFKTKVKELRVEHGEYVLKLVPVECNTHLKINRIVLDDVYKLEDKSITIGSTVEFFVIEDEAVLV